MFHNINKPLMPAPDNGGIFNIFCVRNEKKALPYNPYNRPKDMQYENPQQQAAQSSYEQLKCHFMRYDTNGDGRLSQAELRKAFAALGSRCAPLRAWLSLDEADKNGDGYVNQEELDALIRYAAQWMDSKI